MSTPPCPHCGAKAGQRRADGRCVSCGKQLPEELRATGADVVGAVVHKPAHRLTASPPSLPVGGGVRRLPARQSALWLAAARAVACLPAESFAGLQLLLVSNAADDVNDGWLRLSGHRDPDEIVFF